jgi:hypothetical protein
VPNSLLAAMHFLNARSAGDGLKIVLRRSPIARIMRSFRSLLPCQLVIHLDFFQSSRRQGPEIHIFKRLYFNMNRALIFRAKLFPVFGVSCRCVVVVGMVHCSSLFAMDCYPLLPNPISVNKQSEKVLSGDWKDELSKTSVKSHMS